MQNNTSTHWPGLNAIQWNEKLGAGLDWEKVDEITRFFFF